GIRPIAEIDAAGNLTEFVYARGLAPEYMIRGGETFRFVKDHLGIVRLVVNAATGEIVQRLDFDAWGRVLTDTAPGLQPFGFAGGHHDPDTGLVRFGARDYDPDTGRWTAKDPLGFAGGDTNLRLRRRPSRQLRRLRRHLRRRRHPSRRPRPHHHPRPRLRLRPAPLTRPPHPRQPHPPLRQLPHHLLRPLRHRLRQRLGPLRHRP